MDKPRAFEAAKAVARAVAKETGLNEVMRALAEETGPNKVREELDAAARRRVAIGQTASWRATNYYRMISIAMSKDNPVITVGDSVYPEFPWSGAEEKFSVIHTVGENGWLGKLMVTRGPAPVKEGHVIKGSKPTKTVELSIYDEGDDAELERLVARDPARRMALRAVGMGFLREGRAPPLLQRLYAVAVDAEPQEEPRPKRGQGRVNSVIRGYRGPIVARIVSALAELIPELKPTRNNKAKEPHLSICDAVRDALEGEGIYLSYEAVVRDYGEFKDPPTLL